MESRFWLGNLSGWRRLLRMANGHARRNQQCVVACPIGMLDPRIKRARYCKELKNMSGQRSSAGEGMEL
jgi:hypothetical protein